MNKYFEYFKIGFKNSIEYKSYILSILITPFILGILFYSIWSYIFESKGLKENGSIGGFTFEEMIIYLLIGVIIQSIKGDSALITKISQVIRTGDISTYLCRPISFVKSILSQMIGEKVVNIVVLTTLLIIMTNLLNLTYPKGIMLFIFAIYFFLLVIFYILLSILIGSLSFWFVEVWGFDVTINQIIWVLSGRVIPISIFPNLLINILTFTPFFYLEYTLIRVYLSKLTIIQSLFYLGIFIFWIIVLILIIIFIYKKGYKKLTSFGG